MKFKIAIISHSPTFQKQFSHLADKLDCELVFNIGVLDYAITLAQQMVEDGKVDAIIANERTAELIAEYVSIPVIPLCIKNSNLFDTFYKCHQQGSHIAFVAMADQDGAIPSYDLSYVRQVMGYNIRDYHFHDLDEVPVILERLIDDGCDVLATPAGCLHKKALSRGVSSTLVEFCESELTAAIQHAKDILNVMHMQNVQYYWLNAVLDHTEYGFITMDGGNIITSVSSVAQRVLGTTSKELVGRDAKILSGVHPVFGALLQSKGGIEVLSSDNQELVIAKHDIYTDEGYLGCMLKIEELKNLQWAELQARKKTSANGFVAASVFSDIIGSSDVIEEVKKFAKQYALNDSHILITGESGCGKEIFAQSIHNYSRWHAGPFVALNCATLSEHLLESELFGYEEGTFTGAKKGGKPGLFELAHGGTLFLDEVGEMPLPLQANLLRVLQEKVVRRVGGSKNVPIKVRVIFATNRDLYQRVQEGNFRQDLYYRVNVLNLHIPPLRHRREDIPLIAKALSDRLGAESGTYLMFSPEQLQKLSENHWPGNVRELQNFVARVAAMTPGNAPSDELVDYLLREIANQMQESNELPPPSQANHISVPIGSLKDMETYILENLYQQYEGDKKRLVYTLNLSNTTLWRRLKEANIGIS